MACGKNSRSNQDNFKLNFFNQCQQHGLDHHTSSDVPTSSRSNDISEKQLEIGRIKATNSHFYDFDENLFKAFPMSKGWLKEYAKNRERNASDALIAMMKACMAWDDEFGLMKAMGMKDQEDMRVIQSLYDDIHDEPSN